MSQQESLPEVSPAKLPEQTAVPNPAAQSQTGSLVKALAEACDAVGGVGKKGRNTTQGYDYVKAADVAMAIRHELFQRGIVCIPNEIECTTKQIEFLNAKGETRRASEVVIKTAYTITNGFETLEMHGYGIAWDSGDKAIYKAKTGALKYFLRGLGLIPDEMEPEADETIDRAMRGGKQETNEQFDQRTSDQQNIGPAQIKTIDEALKATGKTEDEIKAALGFIGETRIEHIKKGKFDKFLKWAASKERTKGPKVDDQDRMRVNKKLWALAAEYSIPEADLKTFAYEKFSVDSMSKLTVAQLEETITWVKGVADAVNQS